MEEFQRSIKSRAAEDRLDLYFYRPFGFLCAKAGASLHLSPTQLTLASMAAGIAAGAEFAQPGISHWCLASALLIFSGVLDSADGQLARITGRTTAMGLVLDGICDTVVFVAVYLGCLTQIYPAWGASIWPIAIAAGFSHSVQSATFDYYLREYLYYTTAGHPESYRNPSVAEARDHIRQEHNERWLWRARALWLRQQQLFSTRGESFRQSMHAAMSGNDLNFRTAYHRRQIGRIRQWRWLGSNSHTIGILAFALVGRFDLYLIFVNLTALNTLMLTTWWYQRDSDRRLFAELQERMLES